MILGIDLGTTNCSAAIIKNSKPYFIKIEQDSCLMPSVVSYNNEGNIVVGTIAKKSILIDSKTSIKSIKSFIGTNKTINLLNPNDKKYYKYTPVEISSIILKEIKNRCEKELNTSINKVVITVPAYFGDKARQDTIKAGELAGLNVLRIINEPTAAALSYSILNKNLENFKVMVYDIGGGTFDISLVEINQDVVEVIASDGDRNLGGDNIDSEIVELIKNKINLNEISDSNFLAKLLEEAEKAKIFLSKNESYQFNFKEINFEYNLTISEFNKICDNVLKSTLVKAKSILEKSLLKNSNIEKILLVGGTSRIPYIKTILESLNIKVSDEVNPELAVVAGAAIQASIIEGIDINSILIDVAPHSLSVSCVIEKNGKTIPNFCTKIIKKNTPLPFTVEEVFSTLNEEQDNVRIAIYQGESDFEENNTLIKEINFSNIKNSKNAKIIVQFSYNLDGTVGIDICQDGTENKSIHKLNLGNKYNEKNNSILLN